MFPKFTLLLSAALLINIPVQLCADDWYEKDWAIATGGALAGGVIGYTLGKQHDSDSNRYVCTNRKTYFREKRVFPYYHKIEIYPVLVNSIYSNTMQAVSTVNNPSFESESETISELPYTINIYIGDNNQDVTVSLFDQNQQDNKSNQGKKVTTVNNDTTLPGRKVDLTIKQPTEPDKTNETTSTLQPNQNQD